MCRVWCTCGVCGVRGARVLTCGCASRGRGWQSCDSSKVGARMRQRGLGWERAGCARPVCD